MSNAAAVTKDQENTARAFLKCQQKRGLFSKHYLGTAPLNKYQKELYDKLFTSSRICVKSAHALGKTYTFSEAALEAFVIDAALAGGCYILVTAPTWNLVKNVFFSELRKKARNAKVDLQITVNSADLTIDDKWQIIGCSPRIAVEGDPSTFQGFHAPLVIIIFEEATGVSKSLYDMAEGMMTTPGVKWWAIGNPTDPASPFARLFTKFDWEKVTWDCFLSPNLQANKLYTIEDIRRVAAGIASLDSDEARRDAIMKLKTVDNNLLTAQWVISKYLDWGEASPLFQSKILAQFPILGDNTIFGIKRVEECMRPMALITDKKDPDYEPPVTIALTSDTEDIGVDVARFGSDRTVIFGLRANVETRKETYTKKDTVFTTGRLRDIIAENIKRNMKTRIKIDEGAMGAGVLDPLLNDSKLDNRLVEIIPVNFGATAINEEVYQSKAAEMYFSAAIQADSKEGFVLKQDDILMNELTARKYSYDDKGHRMIESKDKFKARLGISPDIADAFCLAWYMQGDMTAKRMGSWENINKVRLDTQTLRSVAQTIKKW